MKKCFQSLNAELVLLIPAYQPESCLPALLRELSRSSIFAALIVVDDGSSAEFAPIFEEVSRVQGVHVLAHPANCGKGAALKTGFRFAVSMFPGLTGVITADADGQHLADDIRAVSEKAIHQTNELILGVREFCGWVPLRSRFGNVASRAALKILIGQWISDTQTGLRAVPTSLIPALLRVSGNGYGFELEMLLVANELNCHIEEVPIETVYEAGNRSSHFNPIRDSAKICALLFKFLLSKLTTGIISTVLGVAALCAAFGFSTANIFSQQIWFKEGVSHAQQFLVVFAALVLPTAALAKHHFLQIVSVLVVAATIFAVGPIAPLSVLLFLFSATVIGSSVLRPTLPAEWLVSTLSGVAVLVSVEELWVRLPWNYPWVYAGLLCLPALIVSKASMRTLKHAGGLLLRSPSFSLSERSSAAVLAMILTAHLLLVLKPEVSTDGLAMHLAIPDGVAWHHRFVFDLPHNVWAVMPMGGDWCFTFVYLLGGEFAARLLNFAFLAITVALLICACRGLLNLAGALFVSALFAATPLVQLVTGSLFIENILAGVIFGAVAAMSRFEETGKKSHLYSAALLFGTALHIKLGSAAFLTPGLLLLGIQIRRHWRKLGPRPGRVFARAAFIVIIAGFPPYFIALLKTGNPIFPFLNWAIHSRLLAPDAKINETRFHKPLWVGTLYDLTFHTSLYYEGQDGSSGIQYLLLFPAGALLIRRKNYQAWSATVMALAGSLAILCFEPNFRYLYPALPLCHLAIACLLRMVTSAGRTPRVLILPMFALCLSLDLFLFPSSNWYHKDFFAAPALSARGRDLYLSEYEPRRILIDDLNSKHLGEAVFLPNDSAIAGIHAPVFRDHWHDQATKQALEDAHQADDVLELVRKNGIKRFIMPVGYGGIHSPIVRDFATTCVSVDLREGAFISGHLTAACAEKARELKTRRDAVSRRGRVYDDTDQAVRFSGSWKRGEKFSLASGGTLSYSDAPGAFLRFRFSGDVISYVYTSAKNRGIAHVLIDGADKLDLNLYSPGTQWESVATLRGLGTGSHWIQVNVTGRKQSDSLGSFLDLDAFVVPPEEEGKPTSHLPLTHQAPPLALRFGAGT